VALEHLRVVPGGDVLGWVLGIASKFVAALDLLGLEELHGLSPEVFFFLGIGSQVD
jgi:hypothetical protein